MSMHWKEDDTGAAEDRKLLAEHIKTVSSSQKMLDPVITEVVLDGQFSFDISMQIDGAFRSALSGLPAGSRCLVVLFYASHANAAPSSRDLILTVKELDIDPKRDLQDQVDLKVGREFKPLRDP